MLTNLTVTITVRLVEPRINGGMLLPVGTDFCSCLDLDIHRCKVRQNPNIMQPSNPVLFPEAHTRWIGSHRKRRRIGLQERESAKRHRRLLCQILPKYRFVIVSFIVKCSTFLIQMKNLWSLQQRMHIRRQSIIANALQIQLSLLPIINYQPTTLQ